MIPRTPGRAPVARLEAAAVALGLLAIVLGLAAFDVRFGVLAFGVALIVAAVDVRTLRRPRP